MTALLKTGIPLWIKESEGSQSVLQWDEIGSDCFCPQNKLSQWPILHPIFTPPSDPATPRSVRQWDARLRGT